MSVIEVAATTNFRICSSPCLLPHWTTLIISGVSSPHLPQASSWGSFDWQYLAPYEERDTFLSTDAGLAWNIIRRDAHQYELGDSGSILVIGNDETVTNHVRKQSDLGLTVGAKALTTVSDSTSQKFTLLARVSRQDNQQGQGRYAVIFLHFADTRCPSTTKRIPILKNPFNRSTSSLAHLPSTSKPNNAISPPHPRPPTPSNEARPRAPSRSRGHSTARSQHSQSGSIFQSSDTGSDLGHGFSYASSPPPVPRMPNAFGLSTTRGDSPPIPEEDEKFNLGPKTPSDYALHAVFIRFATLAEAKIDVFLRESLDHEPLLSDFIGPMLDEKFDDLLRSLGKIAQKQAKPVIDSIMRWRRSHNENIGGDILKYHNSKSPPWNRGGRTQEPSAILNERKSLASIYIMCRALIAVLQMVSKDALGDATGYSLEETTFEQFKRPDLKLLAQSANHRINAELYATMLGHLGNVRFVSVTDRFLSELGPVASGQVVKDLDTRYENLVKGLRHVQIKVWPPKAFEEDAEFMESLSKAFENAHGLRFKVAFAETLTRLLHPIGKLK
ncbi:cell morphogenesis N-terminal-domain-containing protein [Hygrophoropsis aurantiaca]|uniref:Cell morphogenesis N-terminal-domain-containing protein n=1 Tax=Hygrophoropsis aurantiaca TaxID=72124 RepID=A0ACB7ZXU2_9AGAM|nr:cell morphogenesis N-terminal-domain-containing protein [Hygrophoropsis aurantiaca]